MTLEIVVMLLLVINIYLYITNPVGDVSYVATLAVGDSALAMKAVNDISQKAQMVGISGNGSRDWLEIEMRRSFEGFSCDSSDKELKLTIGVRFATDIDNETNPATFGVTPLVSTNVTKKNVTNRIDFEMDCSNIIELPTDKDYTACVFLNNTDNLINIWAFEKPEYGCDRFIGTECGLAGYTPAFHGTKCVLNYGGNNTCNLITLGDYCNSSCMCATP